MVAKVQQAPPEWPQELWDRYNAQLATCDGPVEPHARQLYRPRPAD